MSAPQASRKAARKGEKSSARAAEAKAAEQVAAEQEVARAAEHASRAAEDAALAVAEAARREEEERQVKELKVPDCQLCMAKAAIIMDVEALAFMPVQHCSRGGPRPSRSKARHLAPTSGNRARIVRVCSN